MTDSAPAAIGPYSQAVQVGDFLYVSGQIPLATSGEIVGGEDIQAQTRQVIKNIMAIIQASDFKFEQILKATCYLTDMSEFQAFNEVYEEYMGNIAPARECVAVAGLPKGVKVEISVICGAD